MHLFQWIFLAFLLSGGALLNPIYAGDDGSAEHEKTDDIQDAQDADEVPETSKEPEEGVDQNDGSESGEISEEEGENS